MIVWVAIITTAAISITAAYFSIYGLALIFAGAFIPVIIMGGVLEAGKMVLTSITYRYWDMMRMSARLYSIIAILSLMAITSGGVYGFLSAAYQTTQLPLLQVDKKLELLLIEQSTKQDRLDRMDAIIDGINADYITKRMEERTQQASERKKLTARLNDIDVQVIELNASKFEIEAHIGPIVYISEVFDIPSSNAANYLILLLVLVFDPLAVMLTIHINMILQISKKALNVGTEQPTNDVNGVNGGTTRQELLNGLRS